MAVRKTSSTTKSSTAAKKTKATASKTAKAAPKAVKKPVAVKQPADNRVFISNDDAYWFGNGTHYQIYKKLGAHPSEENGEKGIFFAVWAPNAKAVHVVGTFNGWNQTEEGGRIAFEDVDGVLTASDVELEAGAEFKVIVPNGDDWTWLGGQDENGVGYFLLTNELLDTPVQLIDGANFRIEEGGTYNLEILESQLDKASSYALRVTKSQPEAIETVATDKQDNTWYNLQGVKFNGQPSAPGIYINGGKKVIIR